MTINNINRTIKKILEDHNMDEERKKRKLRETICTIIYLDRDFSKGQVNANFKYVQKQIDIREKYNEGKLFSRIVDAEKVDGIFREAVFELQENFCDERLRDVERLGKRLYGEKIKKAREEEREKKREKINGKSKPLNNPRRQTGRSVGNNNSGWKEDNQKNSKKDNGINKKVLVVGGIIVLGIVSWFVLKK